MKKILWAICVLCVQGFAEEGMWPFHQIPKEQIANKYGIDLSDEWLEHVQKSCLRISAGGSGSFISSNGLVMTNHHVGASAVQNLSSKENNYFESGFYAVTLEEELPCPNLYVDILVATLDVTHEVNGSLPAGLSFVEKEELRKEAIARLQQEAKEKTGLQPEIVSLYHGAKYYLYFYQRYSDVRLVMAPDQFIAFMGGDIDNFEYPRYSLDMCFFRVYDQGKPLQVEHFLKWGKAGPQEGELLFVAGHPGKTKRMWTQDYLQFSEQVEIPLILHFLERRLEMLEAFAQRGEEEARQTVQMHHSLANAYKVYKGLEKGFKEASPIAKKGRKDALLYGDTSSPAYLPWKNLQEALSNVRAYIEPYLALEGLASNYSKLYGIAKCLVRLAEEKKLPNEKRLLEYVDTEIEKLELNILSKEPFYQDLTKVCLEEAFERLITTLGSSHPLIVDLFGKKTPAEVAQEIALSTKLYDEQVRMELYRSEEALLNSQDPMILLARRIDPYARAVRRQKEEAIDGVYNESYAAIAELEFSRYGTLQYPDATFTLRLSFGEMKGYEGLKSFTTLGGLYQHVEEHGGKDPYFLTNSWIEAKDKINLNTPLNFVSTHDIIGGNSGSPVINSKGEWVGLIFDGNAYSISWSHFFDETLGRSISVHSQGIVEALESVYQAHGLVQEIRGH